jgi:hypothetical protein
MPIRENPHTPPVHRAPTDDPNAEYVPGPKAEVGKPIVHKAPVAEAAKTEAAAETETKPEPAA